MLGRQFHKKAFPTLEYTPLSQGGVQPLRQKEPIQFSLSLRYQGLLWFAGKWLFGSRAKPKACVASSRSVISRRARLETWTLGVRYRPTGIVEANLAADDHVGQERPGEHLRY